MGQLRTLVHYAILVCCCAKADVYMYVWLNLLGELLVELFQGFAFCHTLFLQFFWKSFLDYCILN